MYIYPIHFDSELSNYKSIDKFLHEKRDKNISKIISQKLSNYTRRLYRLKGN